MFNLEDYETVEERLIKFWKDHPDGQIHTKVIDYTSGRFIVEASIYRTEADARPWTTGLAEETIQGRGVNATSALENCETSAIGRALANAGYATKGKRASRETIKPATMPPTMGEAVSMVKEIIGGQTEKDIPHCKHGEMMWKTGTTKAGKPWGHMKCKAAVTGEIGGRCESPNDVIWYEIAPDGSWQRQKARV